MINSVHKAMNILSIISDAENKPVTLTEISQKSGINASTCAHIISTLSEDGYVERVSHREGYILGPETYILTRFGQYDNELINICNPVMRWLKKRHDYTITLAGIRHFTKFNIHRLDKNHPVITSKQGFMHDEIYVTATGKILLVNMGEMELKELYEKIKDSDRDIPSYEVLKKELASISKKEILYVAGGESSTCKTRGYAGAIFQNGKCIGSLGIAANVYKDKTDEFISEIEPLIKKDLKKAILEINRRLSYTDRI